MEFFSTISPNTIIIALVGAVLAYQQYRQGTAKISVTTIQAYKDQVEIMNVRYKEQSDKINVLTGQVGKLQGANEEKEKKIQEYREIFQGKNPELEKILTKIVEFMGAVDTRLQTIEQLHLEITKTETKTAITTK